MYRNLAKTSFINALQYLSSPLYAWHELKSRSSWDGKVPILTYHKVTDFNEGIDSFWNVPPSLFSEQMDYLAQSRYRVISLEEYYLFHCGQRDIQEPCVVLTFDDGYANFFYNAFPVLEKYGFRSTLFLTGQFTGNGNCYQWDRPLVKENPGIYQEVRTLLWPEIEEIQASGSVTFGSHSMSHAHLGLLSKPAVVHEVAASKAHLENRLGQPVEYFSYPGGVRDYGDLSDETERQLKSAEYRLACTSEIGRNGRNENEYRLKRLGICGKDTVSVFRAKISGTLDWVGSAQKVFQRIFSNVY